MREVETYSVSVYELTFLVNVLAQYLTQSRLKQMCGCVVAGDGHAALGVYREMRGLSRLDISLGYLYGVGYLAAYDFLRIGNFRLTGQGNYRARIAYLSAALSVERRGLGNDVCCLTRLGAHYQLFVISDEIYRRVSLGSIVAQKFACKFFIYTVEYRFVSAHVFRAAACFSRGSALYFHALVVALFVYRHTLFFQYLAGKVDREAVSVGKLEAVLARKHIFALFGKVGDVVLQQLHSAVDGAVEVHFLVSKNLNYIIVLFFQLVVFTLVAVYYRLYDVFEEKAVYAEQLAVAYSAANKAAHNVARALVRRQNAIGSKESYRADMVGDNAD